MSRFIKYGDHQIQFSADDSCDRLYQLAKKHFSGVLKGKRFVLYYISKREMHVLPVIHQQLTSQPIRIRKSHDTYLYVLTEDVFDIQIPDVAEESRAETVLDDRTEDWA